MQRRDIFSLLAVGSTAAFPKLAHAAQRLTVVELFTSQGCSSCPPADRVLGTLSQRPDILTLAYHVDYWNYIGWEDPFSSKEWSHRQRRYNRALRSGTYTPQLVVDGQAEMVGSHGRKVKSALEKAPSRRAGASGLSVRLDTSSKQVTAHVKTHHRKGKVLVALLQDKQVTSVRSGENGGEVLENHSIVRTLETAFDAQSASQGSVSFKRNPRWKGPFKVAVLQQDLRTMRILDAAAVPLA